MHLYKHTVRLYILFYAELYSTYLLPTYNKHSHEYITIANISYIVLYCEFEYKQSKIDSIYEIRGVHKHKDPIIKFYVRQEMDKLYRRS